MVKQLLARRGVRFTEKDVSVDQQAGEEMYRLTGQMGVPVTVIDGKAIIGFDEPALEDALKSAPQTQEARPSFGARVGDASRVLQSRGQAPVLGAYVGNVQPETPAGRAGLQAGDIIIEFNGRPIGGADDLEKGLSDAAPRSRVSMVFLRGEQKLRADTSL